jgi:hypothetical protein
MQIGGNIVTDKTELSGVDTLEGQPQPSLYGVSLDGEDFTKEDVKKVAEQVAQNLKREHGRELKKLREERDSFKSRSEELETGYAEAEKAKRQIQAEKLAATDESKKIGLTAERILKYGGEKTADMEAFVKDLTSGVKAEESKPLEVQPPDSLMGVSGANIDSMTPDQKIAWGLSHPKKK